MSEPLEKSYSASILTKLKERKLKRLAKMENREDWRKIHKQSRENRQKWEEEKERKKERKKLEQKTQSEEAVKTEKEIVETRGRPWTLSIALPGSIMDNAQSEELRAYLAGQIARAATIFCVDEIVLFDEMKSLSRNENGEIVNVNTKMRRNGCIHLAKILQYLECPQYLRKAFFPTQPDLKYAGLLNPLDSVHHLRVDSWNEYREGVVTERKFKEGKDGSWVDIGLANDCKIDRSLKSGVRVTVKLDSQCTAETKRLTGVAVSPQEPRTRLGQYWGYKTRVATCLSEALTQCPYSDGYDLIVGTSEKGKNVDQYQMPQFSHALIVFGGLKGLEAALESDDKLNANDPSELFETYLNTCSNQGSGTIRTEEAILITLSALRPKISSAQMKN